MFKKKCKTLHNNFLNNSICVFQVQQSEKLGVGNSLNILFNMLQGF